MTELQVFETYPHELPVHRGDICKAKLKEPTFEAVCDLPLDHPEPQHADISPNGMIRHTWTGGSSGNTFAPAATLRKLYTRLNSICGSAHDEVRTSSMLLRVMLDDLEDLPEYEELRGQIEYSLDQLEDASDALDTAGVDEQDWT